jgi:non-specific serine/threonine protein kinase/serine/threonine-protein kinase
VVARFESERQALALMDHPNIARMYDAGSTGSGRPYFVMEYIEGEPVTAWCDGRRLSTAGRLDLFRKICDGVQHAHRKGIIHRDLKPSNVLVRMVDGTPVPTIIDFGIAKATEKDVAGPSVQTALGMMIGTPEYMSPEQADLTGRDIDTRSDVYSLGVILYELLVGAMPFEPRDAAAVSLDEIRRRIQEDEPSKPSTRVTTLGEASAETARRRRTDLRGLRRQLRGDLDWIAMKALEKDRDRRYASPSELAGDIGRFLRHEPVLAGPPGAVYRTRKFVRRHRLGVAAASMVAVAVALGVAGTAVGLVRAKREAESAGRVAGILEEMLVDFNPGTVQGHARGPEEALDRAIRRIDAELGGEPLVQARLLRNLGRTSYWLGSYDRARAALDRSLEILRERLGEEDLEVVEAMRMVSDLLYQVGDYDGAIRVQEEALEIRHRVQGTGAQEVGYGLANLGGLYWRKADFTKSREYFQRALAVLDGVQGVREVDTASALLSFSLLESDEGKYEAARLHLERALEIKRRILDDPDRHPEVGTILHELGRAHLNSGNLREARKYLEEGRRILSEALGEDHVSLAFSHNHLGRLLALEGEYTAARNHLDRSLEIRENVLGPDHPDVVWSLHSRARLSLRTGELDAGKADLERAMAIVEKAFGVDHLEMKRLRRTWREFENVRESSPL